MQVTELKNESLCYDVKATMSSEDVEKEIDQEINKLSKTITLNGFRPGKAPVSLIKKRYYDSVRIDVINSLVSNFYKKIIDEKKFKLLNEPKVEQFQNEQNKDLEFTLKFELSPNIEMPDFKSIPIVKPIVEVTDENISEFLNELSKQKQNFKEIDDETKIGYRVNIDTVGYISDKEFEGGKLLNYLLIIGSGNFIAGFEDQLIGKKAGEVVDVNVTFPANYYHSELAGKDAKFVVKINLVEESVPNIIDDEFAKKFKLSNLDEMKKEAKKTLVEERENSVLSFMKIKLFNYLNQEVNFEIPESLLEREYNFLKQRITKEDDEEDSMFDGKTPEEINDYYKIIAKRRVKIGLLLSEYAKNNDIEVTDAEIEDAMYHEFYNYSGDKNSLINLYKQYPDLIRNNFYGQLTEKKSVEHIFKHEVNFVEQIVTFEEFQKMSDEEEEIAISV